jgi:hypothetical protein
MKKVATLQIQGYDDRVNIANALLNNGYCVAVIEKKSEINFPGQDYFIEIYEKGSDPDGKSCSYCQSKNVRFKETVNMDEKIVEKVIDCHNCKKESRTWHDL